jgi:ribosome-associated heat shock protein Hsp15
MPGEKVRIDKWLWAARFYKTRSLATDEIGKGRVHVNGQAAKASREVKLGDRISLRGVDIARTITVLGLSQARGPAPVAQLLYSETEDSVQARLKAIEQKRLAPEPSTAIEHGRPSKRDRRTLEHNQNSALRSWNDRWSASVDE